MGVDLISIMIVYTPFLGILSEWSFHGMHHGVLYAIFVKKMFLKMSSFLKKVNFVRNQKDLSFPLGECFEMWSSF